MFRSKRPENTVVRHAHIEQNDDGAWDVVWPDGSRIAGLVDLPDACQLAGEMRVEAGPKFDPPAKGTGMAEPPDDASTEVNIKGRWLRRGGEFSVKGESGRFTMSHSRGDEVTAFGGEPGHEMWRTFKHHRIDTVHTKEKRRAAAVVAHQSADPTVVSHCPFCGSGDVIARSDGNVECNFCSRQFTIQEQPQFSALPGQPGPNGPADPSNPTAPPAALATAPPFVDPDAAPDDQADLNDQAQGDGTPPADPAGDSKQPPWLNKGSSLRTATGALLDDEHMALHLALKHGDREAILAARQR